MLNLRYVNPKYRDALEQAGLLSETALLHWDRGRQIVKKNWADVFRCEIDGVGAVYVKRHFPQQNRLLGAFRRNLALREFCASATMAELGVPQAEPVLTAVVTGRFGLPQCGVYMMREVENAAPLDTVLEQLRDAPDNALLTTIGDELVRLLNLMHAGGFCHWDFKPRNILMTRQADGLVLTPIDARSGKRICRLTRRVFIKRDYAFLLREPLLAPVIENASFTAAVTAPDGRRHDILCQKIRRVIPNRRTVLEGLWDGRPVIIKRFEDAMGWFRCRRERRGLTRLATRGLATPKVLLTGKDAFGRHLLVIEKIDGAVDVITALDAVASESDAKAILLDVFRTVARMHQAGVVQRDLHLGNFLFAPSGIYVIDPAWMRLGKTPVTPRTTLSQLGMLMTTLRRPLLAWEADLLEAYCQERGMDCNESLLEAVRVWADRRRRRRLPHAIKKTLRNSKLFFVLKQSPRRGVFFKEAFTRKQAQDLLATIESLKPEDMKENYRLCAYDRPRGAAAMLSSPARRDWKAAWRAIYTGRTTARPVALVEQTCGLFTKRSWLVTEADPKS